MLHGIILYFLLFFPLHGSSFFYCCRVRFWFRVSPVDANCQNCLRLCLHGECNRQQTSDSRTHRIQIKANANAVSTSGGCWAVGGEKWAEGHGKCRTSQQSCGTLFNFDMCLGFCHLYVQFAM